MAKPALASQIASAPGPPGQSRVGHLNGSEGMNKAKGPPRTAIWGWSRHGLRRGRAARTPPCRWWPWPPARLQRWFPPAPSIS